MSSLGPVRVQWLRRTAYCVVFAAALTACGGGGDPIVARCVINSVSVSPSTATLVVGGSQTLGASANSQDCSSLPTTTWSSNATNIATVSASGSVTAVSPGTATVTATIGSSNGSSVITVTPPPVASIVVTPSSASVQIGGSATLVAQPRDAQGNALTGKALAWQSLAPAIVSVSTSGVVTGVATGTGVVTVTSESITQNVNVTVTPGSPALITVTLGTSTIGIAQTTTATAVVRDANQNVLTSVPLTWLSSNAAVATVSATGVVTGVAAGSATITGRVTAAPSVSANAIVTVFAPVATVTLSPSSVVLEPAPNTSNIAQQLTPVVRDAGNNVLTGRAITYLSSNTAVATVNSSGLVTAVSSGSAFITATAEGISSAALPVVVGRAFAVIDANQSTVASYTPPLINSSGASATVVRVSTGLYTVTIEGIGRNAAHLGSSFAALVNAKSGSGNASVAAPFAICNSTNLVVTGPAVLSVRCEDGITGAVKDAAFRAMVIGNNAFASGGVASLSLHNTFTNSAYTPNDFFSWNSAGAAMTVTHGFGAPEFDGRMARHSQGVAAPFQYSLVSPYTSLPGVACEVQSQLSPSVNSDIVCFDRAGPVNAIHSVVRLNTGRPGRNAGVAFVSGDGTFSGQGFNSALGTVTSTRTGVGRYTVVFGSMVSTSPIGIMVSPWGATGWVFCSHFYTSTDPVTVDVACFNQVGAFIDAPSAFTVLVLQ